jgi:transposase
MRIIHFFIGVDISKATLDITILKDGVFVVHEKIENSTEQIKAWLSKTTKAYAIKRSNSIFCMEHMGLYGSYLIKQLIRAKANIWAESPLQIKKSLGLQRGKNDKIDSLRIAQYCYTNREKFRQFEAPRAEVEQLKLMSALRNRIISSQMQLLVALKGHKNYLKTKTSKTIDNLCKNSLLSLKEDKKAIEMAMLELIQSDEHLNRLFKILTSVHCVGKIIAIELLIVTNEFKKFDSPKKFACYCGVAPFEHTSGTSLKGKSRVSRLANIKMKSRLHLCAVVAIRCKGELYGYYQRKVAEGKPKMSVLNAIRNKIICRIFACVKEDRLYLKKKPAKNN